jgi:hypothetical protein
MLTRRKDSLGELVRRQHEEFMQYQQRRDEEFRRRDEEFRSLTEEMREFNREILLRNEKVYKAVIAEVEEGRRQIQANTKAVLSVLDRLEGAGGAAAA